MALSYGTLAPVGLGDFLEGDLNINQLQWFDVHAMEAQNDGRGNGRGWSSNHEPFQWCWDGRMPDIVTGEVKPRTPMIRSAHGRMQFWDIKTARWRARSLADGKRLRSMAAQRHLTERRHGGEGEYVVGGGWEHA
ncbi:hypothetical protein SLS58_003345 [Diplodia intermedia]|uniref:Uncharacterized protein n=1 Tax=Diplodia intermedia TaxID=856260 RepID=A0ABR3TWU3_9PEZI